MKCSPKRARCPNFLIIGTLLLICSAPAIASAKPFTETDVSRWGSDYQRFAIAKGEAQACADACAKDSKCRAWSYIKPGVMGPLADCRLKSAVPEGRPDPCCVSGIAAGASSDIVAGYASDKKETSLATASKKMTPSGITAATPKIAKTVKTSVTMPKRRTAADLLQMPIEAETPEALGVVGAPIDLVPSK
jgi:hypothetical protein